MGSDMLVALGRATVDGHTLFGRNMSGHANRRQSLALTPGRHFEPGETVRTQYLEILQPRHVLAVLGSRSSGCWGYDHGVNEKQVVAGCLALPATRTSPRAGLLGTDAVRLILERSNSARQGVEVLTDLLQREGQAALPAVRPEEVCDNAYVIADPHEAYAVETAGQHWVYQEIQECRAVTGARVVHQDWDRISSGLAAHAISQGWWPGDGSKLDFAAVFCQHPESQARELRRWGRATLLLEQQNGSIDASYLRRLLCDHCDDGNEELAFLDSGDSEPMCRHARGLEGSTTVASWVTELIGERCALAWCAFGPPCASVFFPMLVDGEFPAAFTHDTSSLGGRLTDRLDAFAGQLESDQDRLFFAREALVRLQTRFEQETEEVLPELSALKEQCAHSELKRQASLFMQHNYEQFQEVLTEVQAPGPWIPAAQ